MLVFENTSGTNPFQVGQGNDDSLRFYYNASEKMRLDSSGNVGIGRTPTVVESAYDSIQLGAGGMYLAGSSNLAAGQLGQNFYADASGNIKYLGNDEAERITFNNGIITFDNAPANTSGAGAALTFNERMRIDASGALLLHPNNSTRGLKITSTTTGTAGDTTTYDTIAAGFGRHVFKTDGSERMRIDASGNLLVGKSVTTATTRGSYIDAQGRMFNAQPNGASPITFQTTFNGTTVGSISVTTSATSYNTSSDRRLKENIADADDAGSKVDAIQVRKFDWKADGSHQDYGMVAQELQTVAPEAVSQGETEDDMMGVDYSKLVPMMLKEIQSLRARVAQLES
jgi:hypothetical protein